MKLPVTRKINLNWMIPNLYMGNGCLTKHPFKFGCLEFQVLLLCQTHRENAGTLGWYPSCLSPPRRPLKGNIPNKYPLHKVYMGLIIKGPPSQGYHTYCFWMNLIVSGIGVIFTDLLCGCLCESRNQKEFRVGDSSWDSSLKPSILGT